MNGDTALLIIISFSIIFVFCYIIEHFTLELFFELGLGDLFKSKKQKKEGNTNINNRKEKERRKIGKEDFIVGKRYRLVDNKDIEDIKINSIWIYQNGKYRGGRSIGEFKSVETGEVSDLFYRRFEPCKNKGERIMQEIKDYFRKHQDTFITLAIVILVDQFVFEGKFREKIKSVMDSMIDKINSQLNMNKKEIADE